MSPLEWEIRARGTFEQITEFAQQQKSYRRLTEGLPEGYALTDVSPFPHPQQSTSWMAVPPQPLGYEVRGRRSPSSLSTTTPRWPQARLFFTMRRR